MNGGVGWRVRSAFRALTGVSIYIQLVGICEIERQNQWAVIETIEKWITLRAIKSFRCMDEQMLNSILFDIVFGSLVVWPLDS